MAAPTLVAAATVTGSTAGITTPSVTVQNGDVVTVFAIGEGTSVGDSFSAPTTTLTTGSVTQLQLHAASSNCNGGAWTMSATANGSGTVSSSYTPAAHNHVAAVFVHRGATAATAGRSASAASSSRTLSYTPSQADSAIMWAVGDWAAGTVQVETPTSTSHNSSTPGPSAVPESARVVGVYTQNVAVLDDQTSTGATSYGIGGSGTGPFTIVVVEVQGTGGASANPFRPPRPIVVPIVRASSF